MSASFIYITAKDREQALSLGRTLVAERLAACANVLDGMTSIYHWQGQTCEEHEAVLIAKTRSELVGQVIERVKQLHSYDCPCVVSWELSQGHEPFLRWIAEQTRE